MKVVKPISTFTFLLHASAALCASEAELLTHETGIWSIEGTSRQQMWIVIHDFKSAQETGVYHLEVLARGRDDPAWKVEHVIRHMAITRSALASSVLKPLHKGAVYPESFDDAYRDWQRRNSGDGGFVCDAHHR